MATTIPKIYIANVIRSALPAPNATTIAPAIAVKMGSLAPQEKNGITRTVAVRSFSSASVRVFIIAGTEQPKPIIIGINARPESPKRRNILSKINAIRAIYPESSKIEKNKNSTKMGGKNDNTDPTPSIIPLLIRPTAHSNILLCSTKPCIQPNNSPTIMSFHKLLIITPGDITPPLYTTDSHFAPYVKGSSVIGSAIPKSTKLGKPNIEPKNKKSSENVRWNIANKIRIKIGIPHIL